MARDLRRARRRVGQRRRRRRGTRSRTPEARGLRHTRLERYRTALDSGTDSAVVGQWIAEVQGDRVRAQQALAAVARDTLDVDQVRAVIDGLGPIGNVLEA